MLLSRRSRKARRSGTHHLWKSSQVEQLEGCTLLTKRVALCTDLRLYKIETHEAQVSFRTPPWSFQRD